MVLSGIGAHTPLLLSVRVGRHEGCLGRDGRRVALIDVRTWNVVIIIINMHQGNVVHIKHTGPVSPVENSSSSAAHAV